MRPSSVAYAKLSTEQETQTSFVQPASKYLSQAMNLSYQSKKRCKFKITSSKSLKMRKNQMWSMN